MAKKRKHAGGRPPVVTEKVIQKLEDAFVEGANDAMSALLAGIGASTLCEYKKAHPEFAKRRKLLGNAFPLKALRVMNIALDKAISDGKADKATLNMAYKIFLSRCPEYAVAKKVEVTAEGGLTHKVSLIADEINKELKDAE